MKIIIIQGMTCLGKSTLCKQLEKDLSKSIYFSLDDYKEQMWDKVGFDSVEQRERQSAIARIYFYKDISNAVKNSSYDYIFLDYVFTFKYGGELLSNLKKWNATVKTLYLKPIDLQEHKKVWESRSRNFTVRHAGHGATHYRNGVGSGYANTYKTKIFEVLPTFNDTLEIDVGFVPYSRSVSYEEILDFIKQ